MLKEAKLYRVVDGKARCLLCWRLCKIEDVGFCGTRVFRNGKLWTLTYGNLSACESRPMEIKPFFHFKPGETALTFSSYSCNLECPWCQNWHISKSPPPENGSYVSPEELVERAVKLGDKGLCASFNEPTLMFEYLLDAFEISKRKGLHNTIVSNGYMIPKALKLLAEWLDGMNVDVKGNEEVYKKFCGGKAKYVWKTVETAKKLGVHVEVVNLLVNGVNDGEEDVRWVVENHLKFAGEEVPLHFTRYFPAYVFREPPTPVERIERAVEIAKKEGVEFVYVGNVPGHRYENTYCPDCGRLLIRRHSYRVLENRIESGKCYNCGRKIYGVF